MKYISLKEWAESKGLNARSARAKAQRGGFQTAQKLGNMWIIEKNEPHIDHRKKPKN